MKKVPGNSYRFTHTISVSRTINQFTHLLELFCSKCYIRIVLHSMLEFCHVLSNFIYDFSIISGFDG